MKAVNRSVSLSGDYHFVFICGQILVECECLQTKHTANPPGSPLSLINLIDDRDECISRRRNLFQEESAVQAQHVHLKLEHRLGEIKCKPLFSRSRSLGVLGASSASISAPTIALGGRPATRGRVRVLLIPRYRRQLEHLDHVSSVFAPRNLGPDSDAKFWSFEKSFEKSF